jgi:hypothetical protein
MTVHEYHTGLLSKRESKITPQSCRPSARSHCRTCRANRGAFSLVESTKVSRRKAHDCCMQPLARSRYHRSAAPQQKHRRCAQDLPSVRRRWLRAFFHSMQDATSGVRKLSWELNVRRRSHPIRTSTATSGRTALPASPHVLGDALPAYTSFWPRLPQPSHLAGSSLHWTTKHQFHQLHQICECLSSQEKLCHNSKSRKSAQQSHRWHFAVTSRRLYIAFSVPAAKEKTYRAKFGLRILRQTAYRL